MASETSIRSGLLFQYFSWCTGSDTQYLLQHCTRGN